MSSVTKDENTLFIVGKHNDDDDLCCCCYDTFVNQQMCVGVYLGHRNNKMYISFEHRPKWSRLTIDDDVPLILAQKHIKSVLDPYQIEFTQVHAYRRWSGTSTMSKLSVFLDLIYFSLDIFKRANGCVKNMQLIENTS